MKKYLFYREYEIKHPILSWKQNREKHTLKRTIEYYKLVKNKIKNKQPINRELEFLFLAWYSKWEYVKSNNFLDRKINKINKIIKKNIRRK